MKAPSPSKIEQRNSHPSGPLPRLPLHPEVMLRASQETTNANEDAFVVLMEQTDWKSGDRHDIAAFSKWLPHEVPDPSALMYALRDQIRLADTYGAEVSGKGKGTATLFQLRYESEARKLALDNAFAAIYGKQEWEELKKKNEFTFWTPFDEKPLVKLEPDASKASRELTTFTHTNERARVDKDDASLLSREAMWERFGIDGELRAVIHLGLPDEGLQMAVVDVRGAQAHPTKPGEVTFSSWHPELAAPPGLLLIPFRGRYEKEGKVTWGGFSARRAIALNPQLSVLPLDRRTDGSEGPLEYMFPDDLKIASVSRNHAELLVEKDGSFTFVTKEKPPIGYTAFQRGLAKRPKGRDVTAAVLENTAAMSVPPVNGRI